MSDKKMFFVNNIEKYKAAEDEDCVEYEVITDAHIVGNLAYGPYSMVVWDFGLFNEGEERSLCLKIKGNKLKNFDLPETSRNGYYHGGSVADEIVALSSLFLRRRLKLGPMTRLNDLPLRSSKKNRWIDKPIIEGERNLVSLEEWFDLVKSLPKKLHQKYILAVRLYHRALLLIEDEPDLAYLNLISSVEVLCQDTDIGEVCLSDLDPKLPSIVNQISEPIKTKLEEILLKRERFIKRRFVKFILNHIENSFWDRERPKVGLIESDKLEEYLGKVYNQRSRTLHSGEPFPPLIDSPPIEDCEINFWLGMSSGEKKWEQKDFIPNPHFFERLINHVLKVYLQKNSKK